MQTEKFNRDYREDVTLADGRRVRLRLLRPTDKRRLSCGFKRLSPEARYQRYFVAKKELTRPELRALTEFDGSNQLALGAVELLRDAEDGGEEGAGMGVARFVRLADEPDVADFAIVVGDEWQGKGLGRLLLERLLAAAAEKGIRRIRCHLLAENDAVRKLINSVRGDAVFKRESELIRAEFSTLPAKAEERAPLFPGQADVYALLRWIASGAAAAPIAFAVVPLQKVLQKMRSYRILP